MFLKGDNKNSSWLKLLSYGCFISITDASKKYATKIVADYSYLGMDVLFQLQMRQKSMQQKFWLMKATWL